MGSKNTKVIEITVGYVFAWAAREARRTAGRVGAEADRTLDAATDQLHGLVSRKLGEDNHTN
ncbi:hypothetical protein ABZ746_36770 [Streptomyces sp. NPDC020096]